MNIFEATERIEEKEEQLRQKVCALNHQQKQNYFRSQAKQLKDPDTYATLNWLFLGGIHHFYLGKYMAFGIELSLFCLSLAGLILGYPYAAFILLGLCLYELPQLFFSQKIARQHNYTRSIQLYAAIKTAKVD